MRSARAGARPAGAPRRPVLLLKRTPAYSYLNKVLIAGVTTTIRKIAQEVALGRAEGLDRPSVANLDNIHVIPKSLVGALLGELPPQRVRELKRALGHALA